MTIPERKVIDITKNNHGESLTEFCKDTKVCILNGRVSPASDNFTCINSRGRSVVDYFLTFHHTLKYCKSVKVFTVSEMIEKCGIVSMINSKCRPPDHSLLNLTISYSMSESDKESQSKNPNLSNKQKFYCFDKKPDHFMNSEVWRQAIAEIIALREIQITSQSEVDEKYDDFCKILMKELDSLLKLKSSSPKVRKKLRISKPFWNQELTDLWRTLRDKEKVYLSFRGTKAMKRKLQADFKFARQCFDKRLRFYERQYNRQKIENIENCNTENPTEFWQHIKNLGPKKKTEIPCKVHDGDGYSTDVNVVLNRWHDDFSSLYNVPDNVNFDDDFYQTKIDELTDLESNLTETNDLVNRELSFDEIEKTVRKLRLKKSVGIDFIPNEILKNHDVKVALFSLFTVFFDIGIIPSLWYKAIVKPIPKGGKKDPYLPLSYRGISILSCVYKVFSGILNHRVLEYCELLDIFVEEQNGFRKGRSCEDHIFTLSSIIKSRLQSRESLFCAFIDMEKAFDWISRPLLFYRLLQYNIDGRMYKALKSLYTHTQSCIQLNDMFTDWFSVSSGVKQGDNVSPTLFALYINELAKEINGLNLGVKFGNVKLSILLYADDMVLLADNENDLQAMLDCMKQWVYKWRLKINTEKSNIVHFRPSRIKRTEHLFMYGDTILDIVNEYKYLGVILDEHLTFEACSKTLADSGGRALGAIISKFKEYKDLGYKTFTKLFDACVAPVLDYGSGIWGKAKVKHAELVQNKAYRYFLGVHKFTPIAAMQAEMGWLPSKYRQYTKMLQFWNRLIKMPNDRLTKQVFMTDYEYRNTWSSALKEIFTDLGLENIFLNKTECNIETCKKLLFEKFEKECIETINIKPKLRQYKLFKMDVQPTDYVKFMSKYDRSLLAKFRCGILQLKVETGRFNNTKLEERLCDVCDLREIEDEYHFLCICTLYSQERQTLFNKVNNKYNDFTNLDMRQKFTFLLSNCSKDVSKFIKRAWDVRKEVLYK